MSIFHERTFAEIDVTLRRGGHINRSDIGFYDYICRHFTVMTSFYEGYGCGLHQHSDGCFYLTGKDSLLRTMLLPKSCVHLGEVIALKARNPQITRSSGFINIDQLFRDIETSVSRETLRRTYAPRRTETTADATITEEIWRALKLLADLRCIEMKGGAIKPLEAIHRFADIARHENAQEDSALPLVIERGVVINAQSNTETKGELDDDRSEN
jgi:chromosome condensin MukBEF MukE localization factor